MKGKLGRTLAAATAASIMVLALAALAWACTAQTRVIALSPQAGPVGSQVVIKGEGVPPGSAVDIRWNGLEGAKLAEVNADAAGYFAATVVIPQTSSDVNYLMAVGQSGVARVPFETAAAAAGSGPRQPADLWSGFSSDAAGLGADQAPGDTGIAVPQVAMLATVAVLGAGAFTFGIVAGARRRRAVS